MLYKPESLERPQVILQTWLISFSVTSELTQYLSQTENSGDSPIYPQCYPVSKTIQIIYRNPICAFFFFFKFFNNKAPKRKQNYKMCHKKDKDQPWSHLAQSVPLSNGSDPQKDSEKDADSLFITPFFIHWNLNTHWPNTLEQGVLY